MNIALGAVIIFILLIPPVAFYLSFSTSSVSNAKPSGKFSLLDGILATAVIGHTYIMHMDNTMANSV